MKLRKNILNFLLIRDSEFKLVQKLFLFEFFQGSAIAIYFTCSISIFLKYLPTTYLPKVYILASLLLWATGYIYNKLEHLLSTKVLIKVIIAFNIFSLLSLRFLISQQHEAWFLYLFLSFFNVLYLLNNLDFWGLAAQLFDVRQSKRLFGIISSGDIPAKMVGYLSAYIISPYIGTENLLIVGCLMLLASYFIINPLIKLANLEHHEVKTHKKKISKSTESFESIRIAFFGNKLIRKIAIISFFSFTCYIIISFVFYGYVKNTFKSDSSLVAFFSIFFFTVSGLTLILKIAGTNKLVDHLGLKKSLLISPIILSVLGLLIIYFSLNSTSTKIIFYLYGVMIVVIDVLRSSIQNPVLLATMQPLPVKSRLRGHTLIKGLMDPFAFLFIGIFLYYFVSESLFNFGVLSFAIFVLIGFWIYFTLSLEKDYLNTLQSAIRNRTLNEREINFSDKESIDYLINKIENGNEAEGISALQLLSAKPIKSYNFLEKSLSHKSTYIVNYSLEIILEENIVEMKHKLIELLNKTSNHVIIPNLIKAIKHFDKDFDIWNYVNHPNPDVSITASILYIKENSINLNLINELILAEDITKKIKGLKIIAELKLSNYETKIIEFLNSSNKDLQNAAIKTIGFVATEKLVKKLLLLFKNDPKNYLIIESLEKVGELADLLIIEQLNQKENTDSQTKILINLLGKIGSETSINGLNSLLEKNIEYSDLAAQSIKKIGKISKEKIDYYEELILKYLSSGINIIYKIHHTQNSKIISTALEIELLKIRNISLDLFSILYDKHIIEKVKTGFKETTKDSIANSLELLEVTCPKKITSIFSALFENISINDKCIQLNEIVPQKKLDEFELIKSILFDVDYNYTFWTKSCVLYANKKRINEIKKEHIKPFVNSSNQVLRETAKHILNSSFKTN